MFFIISCIFIYWSNANAARFQCNLGMANPIEDLQTGQQWLKDDASTKIFATALRDYNFCLNRNNKNFQSANKILEGATGCDWQESSKHCV